MTDPRTAAALSEVLAQDARQAELDRLYEADGRHDPHHPMHALYTGLLTTTTEQENDGDD